MYKVHGRMNDTNGRYVKSKTWHLAKESPYEAQAVPKELDHANAQQDI